MPQRQSRNPFQQLAGAVQGSLGAAVRPVAHCRRRHADATAVVATPPLRATAPA